MAKTECVLYRFTNKNAIFCNLLITNEQRPITNNQQPSVSGQKKPRQT